MLLKKLLHVLLILISSCISKLTSLPITLFTLAFLPWGVRGLRASFADPPLGDRRGSYSKTASEFVNKLPSLLARHGCQVLLLTGQNLELQIIAMVIGVYGKLVCSSIRTKEASNQCTTYFSSWLDIVWAGIIRLPFVLGILSVLLRNLRREQSQIIAGGAFYTALLGILRIACSRLPPEYGYCLVFSWTAILVLGAVILRAPGRFYWSFQGMFGWVLSKLQLNEIELIEIRGRGDIDEW